VVWGPWGIHNEGRGRGAEQGESGEGCMVYLLEGSIGMWVLSFNVGSSTTLARCALARGIWGAKRADALAVYRPTVMISSAKTQHATTLRRDTGHRD
jgi:hypothetical protein